MCKRQLIEEIRVLNATAPVRFLTQFDEVALQQYLDHLLSAKSKRVRIHQWNHQPSNLRMVS